MNFREFLLEFNYLDIGHDYPAILWWSKNGKIFTSDDWKDVHRKPAEFSGRFEKSAKILSIVYDSQIPMTLINNLFKKFNPNEIFVFQKGSDSRAGMPLQDYLNKNESFSYLGIGHRSPSVLWWSDGNSIKTNDNWENGHYRITKKDWDGAKFSGRYEIQTKKLSIVNQPYIIDGLSHPNTETIPMRLINNLYKKFNPEEVFVFDRNGENGIPLHDYLNKNTEGSVESNI